MSYIALACVVMQVAGCIALGLYLAIRIWYMD